MSESGGDTGGGGGFDASNSTGAGESGGSAKGGMGQGDTGAAGKGASDGATFDPGGNVADYSSGGGYTDPTSGYAPSDSGGSGALPSEITTGTSDPGASQWGAPSINDFIDTSTDGGFNLGGSGPVGGDSGLPGAGGGTNTPMAFDTYSASGNNVPAASDNAVAAAPAANNAAAFAAPEGVSGTPQLDSLVAAPDAGAYPAMSQSDQGVFDSLNGAQAAVVDQQANNYAPVDPVASGGSTTLPAVSAPSGSSGGGGNSQTTGILPGVSNNSLGILAAGTGLLNNLIKGNSATPATAALQGQAATNNATSADLIARGTQQGEQFGTPALQSGQDQTARGAALQQYVATGTLPEGYEAQIQQGAAAAKQTIISNYANRGLPTDPTRNSALAQELAQVDARLPAMREQLAAQLAQTGNSIVGAGNQTSQTGNALTSNGLVTSGVQAAGISSNIYQTLANLENNQNQQRGAAIANFAAALNGGTRPKAA